ncbi:hypothetical protein IPL68_02830 [Candidatus Saccharibacteria bacterium]|nr:MAG: hypothetical protein IPL68_02830 [Candidatus Saccharibacteria bacterium]
MRTKTLFAIVGLIIMGTALMSLPGRVYASVGDVANCPTGQTNLVKSPRTCCPTGHHTDTQDCFVAKYVNPAIKLFSMIAGVAIIAGVIMGGIQYSASTGDPQKAAAAKSKISKALVSLMVFMFLFAGIQFMSPGALNKTSTPAAGTGSLATRCSKPFLGLKPWFAYLPDDAFADGSGGGKTCDVTNFKLLGDDSTKSHLLPVVLALVDTLVRVAGLVAVGFVITGGILLTTSQGEPDKTKKARETIINALIGLVVAIVAAVVVSYIGGRLSQ